MSLTPGTRTAGVIVNRLRLKARAGWARLGVMPVSHSSESRQAGGALTVVLASLRRLFQPKMCCGFGLRVRFRVLRAHRTARPGARAQRSLGLRLPGHSARSLPVALI